MAEPFREDSQLVASLERLVVELEALAGTPPEQRSTAMQSMQSTAATGGPGAGLLVGLAVVGGILYLATRKGGGH